MTDATNEDIARAIKLGIMIEAGSGAPVPKLDLKQIEWLSNWLAGEGFSRHPAIHTSRVTHQIITTSQGDGKSIHDIVTQSQKALDEYQEAQSGTTHMAVAESLALTLRDLLEWVSTPAEWTESEERGRQLAELLDLAKASITYYANVQKGTVNMPVAGALAHALQEFIDWFAERPKLISPKEGGQ